MTANRWMGSHFGRRLLAGTMAASLCLLTGPALSAEGIDPDADSVLKSMSTYLAGLPSFSTSADIDNEIVDLEGQKLQLSSTASVAIQHPGNLHIHRKGAYADVEILFDGETLTLYSKGKDVFWQANSPGNIDQAIRTMEIETGLDMPGADLLVENPYASLIEGATSGAYLGTAYVHGIECHYLSFRADKVDWQLWVQTGETPLPMKYVITTKWVTAAPQYSIRFRDWNTQAEFAADQFAFTAPAGAQEIDTLPAVNEIGEFVEGAQ